MIDRLARFAVYLQRKDVPLIIPCQTWNSYSEGFVKNELSLALVPTYAATFLVRIRFSGLGEDGFYHLCALMYLRIL